MSSEHWQSGDPRIALPDVKAARIVVHGPAIERVIDGRTRLFSDAIVGAEVCTHDYGDWGGVSGKLWYVEFDLGLPTLGADDEWPKGWVWLAVPSVQKEE